MFEPTSAAYIYTSLSSVVVFFQLALALGAPWGEMTMGGRFPGRLPLRMRVAALVQMALLTLFMLVVLVRAGLILEPFVPFYQTAIWVVVAFGVVGLVLNIITPSKKERTVWAPIAAVLLISSSYVAMS